jgi:hypothetical protein
MSKSRIGNFIGIFFALLGVGVIFVAWQTKIGWLAGLGVALTIYGAGIFRPDVVKEGAVTFKENADGVREVFELGRRASDGQAAKVDEDK